MAQDDANRNCAAPRARCSLPATIAPCLALRRGSGKPPGEDGPSTHRTLTENPRAPSRWSFAATPPLPARRQDATRRTPKIASTEWVCPGGRRRRRARLWVVPPLTATWIHTVYSRLAARSGSCMSPSIPRTILQSMGNGVRLSGTNHRSGRRPVGWAFGTDRLGFPLSGNSSFCAMARCRRSSLGRFDGIVVVGIERIYR